MSPETAELARALVASPRWGWRAGMRDTQGARVRDCGLFDLPDDWSPAEYARLGQQHIPDLDDPATVGVLQGVLSRLATISVRIRPDPYGASVLYWLGDRPHATPLCPTLGVAVARALLSTWEQP